jgi:hypothetical protein
MSWAIKLHSKTTDGCTWANNSDVLMEPSPHIKVNLHRVKRIKQEGQESIFTRRVPSHSWAATAVIEFTWERATRVGHWDKTPSPIASTQSTLT